MLRFSSHVFLALGWRLFWCQQKLYSHLYLRDSACSNRCFVWGKHVRQNDWANGSLLKTPSQKKKTFWIMENVKKRRKTGRCKLKASTSFCMLETCEVKQTWNESFLLSWGKQLLGRPCYLADFAVFSLIPSSLLWPTGRSEGRSPGLPRSKTTLNPPHRGRGRRPQRSSSRLGLSVMSFCWMCTACTNQSRIMGKPWTLGNGLVMKACWLRLKPSSDKYASKKKKKTPVLKKIFLFIYQKKQVLHFMFV